MCPVKALVHIVFECLQDGGADNKLLCDYKHSNKWQSMESSNIIKLQMAVYGEQQHHQIGLISQLVAGVLYTL